MIFELNIAADVTEWNLRLPVEPLGGKSHIRAKQPYDPDHHDITERPVDKFLQHYQVSSGRGVPKVERERSGEG